MSRFDDFLLHKRYVNRRRKNIYIWKRQVCEKSAQKRKKSKRNTWHSTSTSHNENNSIIRKGKSNRRRNSRMGWQTGIVDDWIRAANSNRFYGIAFRVLLWLHASKSYDSQMKFFCWCLFFLSATFGKYFVPSLHIVFGSLRSIRFRFRCF